MDILFKRQHKILAICTLVVLTLCAYVNLFANEFVNFDDQNFILLNDWVTAFDLEKLRDVFSHQREGHYQPLSWLLYACEYKLFNENILGYHWVSLLLHLSNALFCALISKQFKLRLDQIFWVVLLFLLHPLMVESVAWKAAQNTLLFSVFSFGAFLMFLHHQKNKLKLYYLASLFLFLLSLMSKSMAVVTPLYFFVYLFLMDKEKSMRKYAGLLPFFLLSICFGIAALKSASAFGSLLSSKNNFEPFDYLFVSSRALFFYVERFFMPLKLSALHFNPLKQDGLLPFYFYLIPLVFIVLIYGLKKIEKDQKLLWFFIACFVSSLSAVIRIVPIGNTLVAERYAYQGVFFLACFVVVFTQRFRVQKILLALIAFVFLLLTFFRVGVWNTSQTLFQDITKKYTRQAYAHFGYGVALNDAFEYDKAIEALKTSAQLDASYARTFNALCVSYMGKQKYDSALYYAALALKKDAKLIKAMTNHAFCADKLGRPEIAQRDYSAILFLDSNNQKALKNRALASYKLKDYTQAISDLKGLNHLSFSFAQNIDHAVLLNQMGAHKRAIQYLSKLEAPKAYKWALELNLAASYRLNHMLDSALFFAKRAQKSKSNQQVQKELFLIDQALKLKKNN